MLAHAVAFIGPANLVTALITINFITFALFGIDKARAEAGSWRIAEKTLLNWALIGGTFGAYAGRALFRHKTRKASFSNGLHSIATLQILVMMGLGGWWLWVEGLPHRLS
ncbi:MAG: DUF1294 domain-containing protein [Sphingomonadales bacterium]|nr:DUF1294 domain-containing protein [Sphingomonadales bacterium]